MFKLRWEDHFPLQFDRENCRAEYASPAEGLDFLLNHYREIHKLDQAENRFLNETFDEAKLSYYQKEGDFFLVKENGISKGIIVGTINDWSSYNLRTSSFLRDFQGSGIHTRLISYLLSVLKKQGVARVEADASPANFATLQILLRFRFYVTGLNLSERWGGTIHLTKFLTDEPEAKFLEHFCSSPKTHRNPLNHDSRGS